MKQVNDDGNIQHHGKPSYTHSKKLKKDTTMPSSSSSRGGIFGYLVPLAIVLYHTNILSLENISAVTTKLLSTALPPPGPLPPPSSSPELSLQRFLTPFILLYIAFLIPAKTRFTQWIVSAIFFPAIAYIHWGSLSYGSRSSAVGFGIGVGAVFHVYQSFDLLILSNPRKEFFRVPISIQKEYYLSSKPIPPEFFDPYPPTLAQRIPWVFELVLSARWVGWHTPNSKPTTSRISLLFSKPMSRRDFLRITLLRIIGVVLVIDFLIWNIRVNDTGYFCPQLLLNRNDTTPVSKQVAFQSNFNSIAIYPNPPTFQTTFPFFSLTPAVSLPSEKIPNPRYFPLPAPTKSSSDGYKTYIFPLAVASSRALTQLVAVYCGIAGLTSVLCLIVILASYFVYPPGSSPSSEKLKESRWLNPEAYPHAFQFSLVYADPPALSSPSSVSSSEDESDSESDSSKKQVQKRKQTENEIIDSYSIPSVSLFWSTYWHNFFRRGFLRPWIVLTSILFPSPSPSPITAFLKKSFTTIGVFVLSGFLHFAGAVTQTSSSRSHASPTGAGYGSLTFFTLQSLYIILEQSISLILPRFISTRIPKPIKFIISSSCSLLFLLFSCPYFYDEFRWGGLWRTEAAPWSIWQVGWFRWAGLIGENENDRWGWAKWSDGQGGTGWWLLI